MKSQRFSSPSWNESSSLGRQIRGLASGRTSLGIQYWGFIFQNLLQQRENSEETFEERVGEKSVRKWIVKLQYIFLMFLISSCLFMGGVKKSNMAVLNLSVQGTEWEIHYFRWPRSYVSPQNTTQKGTHWISWQNIPDRTKRIIRHSCFLYYGWTNRDNRQFYIHKYLVHILAQKPCLLLYHEEMTTNCLMFPPFCQWVAKIENDGWNQCVFTLKTRKNSLYLFQVISDISSEYGFIYNHIENLYIEHSCEKFLGMNTCLWRLLLQQYQAQYKDKMHYRN